MWFVIILAIIVIVVFLVKGSNKGSSYSQEDVSLLFSYYEKIRNDYYNGSDGNSIIVGGPLIEYNNDYVVSSFLAVYVSEDNNAGAGRAEALGMQTKVRKDKFEHQFIVKKKLSKQAKRQIMQDLMRRIQEYYPNDLLSYDNSLPLLIAGIEMKDFMEMIQNNR